MDRHLSRDLAEKASGAVVDRRSHYIGLIINGEECSFQPIDLTSFDKAIGLLSNVGVPVHEERKILRAFWLTVAAGLSLILVLWIIH
ncbi:hypothetical protein [Neoaquamicrobium sediminum]|uniref:hypothetical protein n=1 Tax=Neoaquamicrobium sediminum TaxID=1849104 RepID=UPI001564A4EF|nr:hypothetical protein [Mesorhizobium sediminum]NRC57250.1 hypothetical protein [Mesorhizobium sediminum]